MHEFPLRCQIVIDVLESEPPPVKLGVPFEGPIEEGIAVVLSRPALHGHEVGLNGVKDVDCSLVDVPLQILRPPLVGPGSLVPGTCRGQSPALLPGPLLLIGWVSPICLRSSGHSISSAPGKRSGPPPIFVSLRRSSSSSDEPSLSLYISSAIPRPEGSFCPLTPDAD
jgi:hypothetical protein